MAILVVRLLLFWSQISYWSAPYLCFVKILAHTYVIHVITLASTFIQNTIRHIDGVIYSILWVVSIFNIIPHDCSWSWSILWLLFTCSTICRHSRILCPPCGKIRRYLWWFLDLLDIIISVLKSWFIDYEILMKTKDAWWNVFCWVSNLPPASLICGYWPQRDSLIHRYLLRFILKLQYLILSVYLLIAFVDLKISFRSLSYVWYVVVTIV